MITTYTKHSIETIVRQPRAALLAKALASLHSHYESVLRSLRSSLPGGTGKDDGYQESIEAWLSSDVKRDLVIDLFRPKSHADTLLFVKLRDVKPLATSFGKRHHAKGGGYLTLYGFSQGRDGRERIDAFGRSLAKATQRAFRLSTMPTLTPIGTINEKVDELKKKHKEPEPIAVEHFRAIDLLVNPQFRGVVIRTRQAKDPTLENIAKSAGLDILETKTIIEGAVRSGVLVKHYNVVCANCKDVLARVDAARAIRELRKQGVACAKCGNPVDTKSQVDCYKVADEIAPLLDGSQWMHLHLRRLVDPLLPAGKSLTSVQDGPNELDLIASVDGEFLLAELKDSRFSIGHAYSFVGKCSQYRPDIPMIVATEGVDDDVKEYIRNTGISAEYVEGIENAGDAIAAAISKRNGYRLAQLLNEINWVSVVPHTILAHYDALPKDSAAHGMIRMQRYAFHQRSRAWPTAGF